jgi:3-oxoacyl-[acyl-carrier protein] reductase
MAEAAPMFSLAGQVALVTGGARGIGAAVARTLAGQGARVLLNYRSSEAAAAAVVSEIEGAGGRAETVRFDVGDEEAVQAGFKALLGRHERLDILVNNAGVAVDGLVARTKAAQLEQMIRTNQLGTVFCARAAVRPMMRARYGRIVNLSSVVADMGNAGQAGYAMTKAGIEGFTRSLAREVASRNITCNTVSPGFIDTDMTAALDDSVRTRYVQQVPVGRLGEPSDVAAAIAFLVSREAAYVTGQTVRVNGGLYL